MFRATLVCALLAAAGAVSTNSASRSSRADLAAGQRANPIRRVVTLLQNMQKQVTEEGKNEEDLYKKFMCYCTTGKSQLETSITMAEEKIPKVTSALEEAKSRKAQLDSDIKKHKADRAEGKQALATATALRSKEASAYARLSSDFSTNLSALKAATAAIEKGMAGAFLQSAQASTLRKLSIDVDMSPADRDMLTAFLSQGEGYAPKSGQIVGILKEMSDTMGKELSDATATEEAAIKDYEALAAAKTKEIEALSASIEATLEKSGKLALDIVAMKEDIDDTSKTLSEDKAFLDGLETGCATKKAEWEERSKIRTDELLAIAETIKILNSDDSLELFKKTLPSASASSFVQIQVSSKAMRRRAQSAVKRARRQAADRHRARIDLIALALSGKKVEFTKVLKLIDDMVEMLQKEQVEDETKKEYCAVELDAADDKKKAAENALEDANHNKESCKAGIATLAEEIAALIDGIKALDKEVAAQTQQRKAENTEYKELLASDSAAKELLKIAKNRLNKFYNPKLYVPPAKKELGAVDAVARDFNVALVQVSESRSEVDPGPPPDTFGEYKKTSEENTGVIEMINTLIKSLDLDMTEAKAEEKNAQEEYVLFIKDSAGKRQADTKAVADKEESKANLEADLEEYKAAMVSAYKELEATAQYISSLHAQCDFLLNFFEVRKKARAGEIGALQDAKAVLSGADYSS
mmetsp:Transcript_108741/g.283586  ORF Transcript_108741/g.283586 Transcript_108741/m.283586 type:complete len:699 (+) Transcript_108741:74-2170(+)